MIVKFKCGLKKGWIKFNEMIEYLLYCITCRKTLMQKINENQEKLKNKNLKEFKK